MEMIKLASKIAFSVSNVAFYFLLIFHSLFIP